MLAWLTTNATLVIAVIGAVNGTIGVVLNLLNRRDARREARSRRETGELWAEVETSPELGPHAVRLTFHNPARARYVVRHFEVLKPDGCLVALDPRGPDAPFGASPGEASTVDWVIEPSSDPADDRAGHVVLTIWPGADAVLPRPLPAAPDQLLSLPIRMRFHGWIIGRARTPVALEVSARLSMNATSAGKAERDAKRREAVVYGPYNVVTRGFTDPRTGRLRIVHTDETWTHRVEPAKRTPSRSRPRTKDGG